MLDGSSRHLSQKPKKKAFEISQRDITFHGAVDLRVQITERSDDNSHTRTIDSPRHHAEPLNTHSTKLDFAFKASQPRPFTQTMASFLLIWLTYEASNDY